MVAAILLLPLIPFHTRQSYLIIRLFIGNKQAVAESVDRQDGLFLLLWHLLSLASLCFLCLNAIFGASCGLVLRYMPERAGYCSSVQFLFGKASGAYSNMGNLGFILEIFFQAILGYYAEKEVKSSRRTFPKFQNAMRVWKFIVAALIVAGSIAYILAIVANEVENLAPTLLAVVLVGLVSLTTFGLVLKLSCTIHYTYRILPFLSTRLLLLIVSIQTFASILYAISGALLTQLIRQSTRDFASAQPVTQSASSFVDGLADPRTAVAVLYSLAYALLSITKYLFVWLLLPYSRQLASSTQARYKQLGDVNEPPQ